MNGDCVQWEKKWIPFVQRMRRNDGGRDRRYDLVSDQCLWLTHRRPMVLCGYTTIRTGNVWCVFTCKLNKVELRQDEPALGISSP